MIHVKLFLLITSFILPMTSSAMVFWQNDKSLPKRVMGLALLNCMVVFLFNYFFFDSAFPVYSCLHSLHIATMLWLFPSFYLYIRAIVLDEKAFRREWHHLLPGVVCGVLSATIFFGWLDQGERIYYLINYRHGSEFTAWNLKSLFYLRMAVVTLLTVQVIGYSFVLIRLPQCYKKRLLEEFSNIERFSLDWVKWLTLSFLLIATLCVLFYAFSPLEGRTDVALIIFLFLFAVIIWVMGLFSLRQQKAQIVFVAAECFAPSPPPETAATDDALSVKLIDYMVNQQAFLQHDITLSMVSREIGTNRTYLSIHINQQYGMNFNAFINQYRADYARNHLMLHPQTTQEELAQESGFGSVSSMRRAMKRG